jgi:SAM-dependent MidA family methyltransferase
MDINLSEPESLHTKALAALIRQKIQLNQGWIRFSDYMQMALYEPKLGYYCSKREKLGSRGDFTTAPEISPFFGKTIVNSILPALDALRKQGKKTRILEIGAGTGKLAQSIIEHLHDVGFPLNEYTILEISPELQEIQKKRLSHDPSKTECVWLDSLPNYFSGIVIANEVFDAIPCETIILHQNQWYWYGVALASDENQLIWKRGKALSQNEIANDLPPILKNTHLYNQGYITEIHPQAKNWIVRIMNMIEFGFFLSLDYGFPAKEYYHPQRNQGSILAHYRHQVMSDFLNIPGICDLTTHVEWSSLAEAANQNGCKAIFYSSQAAFLLEAGIGELALNAAKPDDPTVFLPISNQLQTLLSEAEMGELFKVMAFEKNLIPLSLFNLPGLSGRIRSY